MGLQKSLTAIFQDGETELEVDQVVFQRVFYSASVIFHTAHGSYQNRLIVVSGLFELWRRTPDGKQEVDFRLRCKRR